MKAHVGLGNVEEGRLATKVKPRARVRKRPSLGANYQKIN